MTGLESCLRHIIILVERIKPMIHFDLKQRGYRPLFRSTGSNTCPGCGHSQWLVGRTTAECAFCQTALPIAETHSVVSLHTWKRAAA